MQVEDTPVVDVSANAAMFMDAVLAGAVAVLAGAALDALRA